MQLIDLRSVHLNKEDKVMERMMKSDHCQSDDSRLVNPVPAC